MTRHGYQDDIDQQDLAMWRGRVVSSIRGRRGQKMLKELRDALDALPEKRLVTGALHTSDGDCCTLGCLASVKGKDYKQYADDEDAQEDLNEDLASLFNVTECMVREIEWENDEGGAHQQTPEQRWSRMRKWVDSQIAPEKASIQ